MYRHKTWIDVLGGLGERVKATDIVEYQKAGSFLDQCLILSLHERHVQLDIVCNITNRNFYCVVRDDPGIWLLFQ